MPHYPIPLKEERDLLKTAKKAALQNGVNINEEFTCNIIDFLRDNMLDNKYTNPNQCNIPQEQNEQNQFLRNYKSIYHFTLFLELLKHQMISYYFETVDLKIFFEQTDIKELESVKDYISKNGVSCKNDKEDSYKVLGFHLRFPDTPCLSCTLTLNEEVQVLSVFIMYKDYKLFIENLDNFNLKSFKGKEGIKEQNLWLKQVFNFIYYIDCFPETVVDGKPRNIEKSTIVQFSPIRTIKVHKDIVESVESDGKVRVTHFRRGHFRYFRSDYFVNKKGSRTFIHASIIKGSPAKTVKMLENEETLKAL